MNISVIFVQQIMNLIFHQLRMVRSYKINSQVVNFVKKKMELLYPFVIKKKNGAVSSTAYSLFSCLCHLSFLCYIP